MTTLLPGNSRPRLLGVFAHPDDECFCAGGTLARYAAAGAETMVVSATRGEAGQIRDAHSATRRTLGQVRAGELTLACGRLGIQHPLCLDYGDGRLKDVDQEVLTSHVAQIIRAFRPDVVLTFGEDGAYGHPDHRAIGRATTAACTLAGDAARFPEQLTAGGRAYRPARLYHSRFPPGRMLFLEHLVQWLVSRETSFRGTLDFAQGMQFLAEEATLLGYTRDHVEVPWFPSGVHLVEQGEDVRDYVDRKLAAIAAHRTQCPIRPDMLPLATFQEMMGREYIVHVAPDQERLGRTGVRQRLGAGLLQG